MRFIRWTALAALAGCAAQPAPVADNTPQNPTAVFETKFTSSGLAGAFPFETTEKHYVRATRGAGARQRLQCPRRLQATEFGVRVVII